MILEATITCPACGAAKTETMPTDACQFFYECPGCGALLRPKPGDCCVFCSYADVPCPPVQALRNLGSRGMPDESAGSSASASPCHGQACRHDRKEDG
ncbi:hypothetical protein OL599_17585 [Rhodovastum sp. RN2-1]|uniref:Uncharacterized protein n=1 Tax=Limobrevibacterium gyesilva TaxID=2991712 RepID=A0AA41YM25_9PROT|nr:hypothetical protein [Limobrevibacterium gyesilva]